jgi:hypothetical protein
VVYAAPWIVAVPEACGKMTTTYERRLRTTSSEPARPYPEAPAVDAALGTEGIWLAWGCHRSPRESDAGCEQLLRAKFGLALLSGEHYASAWGLWGNGSPAARQKTARSRDGDVSMFIRPALVC